MSTHSTRHIGSIALMVNDYGDAIKFYCEQLSFTLLCDQATDDNNRWVQLAPGENSGVNLVLMKAKNDQQQAAVGNQTGGPVLLFLHTDNFWQDYEHMQQHGVRFLETPREEVYGTVAVFEDLYGNKWDLIQPAS